MRKTRILRKNKLSIKDSEKKELVVDSKSPNFGSELIPKYLVMHYTAGDKLSSTINWLTSKKSQASAHLVIDRNGEVHQLVPFDKIAHHAGPSSWEGLIGLNKYSIGIEIVNAGKLKKSGNQWITFYNEPIPNEEIVVLKHKFEDTEYGWQTYPEVQLNTAIEVAREIVSFFDLLDVIGHDDISPRRKFDPGPAFPMDNFRSKVMGRETSKIPTYITTANLQLLSEPKPDAEIVESLIPIETEFEILERKLDWILIRTTSKIGDFVGKTGWIVDWFYKRKSSKRGFYEPL